MSERARLAKSLLGMAEAFGRPMTEAGLKFYLDGLSDLPAEAVLRGMSEIARSSKTMPTIAEIRLKADPSTAVTDEQQALEAVSRIIFALGKFGYTNPDKAKEYIGELGWKVVEREGGWLQLCERTTNEDLPITRAQLRELAKALIARSKAGILDEAPALPGPVKELVQKLIEEKK